MTKAKLKIISGVLALAVVAGGICSLGYASRNETGKWFANSNLSSWHWSDKSSDELSNVNGNTVIGEGESNGVSLHSAAIPVADYDEYGIDTQAESAVIITATITPAATTNKTVTWTTNDASGKVKVTPVSSNPLQATVQVLGAFDKQVTITCTSNSNTSVKATCTVDYVKSYSFYSEKSCDDNITSGVSSDALTPHFGAGTLTPTSCKGDVWMEMDSNLYNYLHTKHSTVKANAYIRNDVDVMTGSDTYCISELFGTTDTAKVKAIWQDIATYYYGTDEYVTYGTLQYEDVEFYYNGKLASYAEGDSVIDYCMRTDNFYDITVIASDVTLNNGSLIFGANGQVQ